MVKTITTEPHDLEVQQGVQLVLAQLLLLRQGWQRRTVVHHREQQGAHSRLRWKGSKQTDKLPEDKIKVDKKK